MISICIRYLLSLTFMLFPMVVFGVEQSPILTTTAIIEVYDHDEFLGIVLIERETGPYSKALPCGKVEYGETVENAVRREMLKTVKLELVGLLQFHVYSQPSRDPRHHSVEITHLARAYTEPRAGSEVAKVFVVKLNEIPWRELAFDHAAILRDYLNYKSNPQQWRSKLS
jgi:8-oxo-dGTP diphosphatase